MVLISFCTFPNSLFGQEQEPHPLSLQYNYGINHHYTEIRNPSWNPDTFPCIIQIKLIFKCAATAYNLRSLTLNP